MTGGNQANDCPIGWVAYAVSAVVAAVGDNKLMPEPDCGATVINGKSGYARDNSSWIIGRLVRDFDDWKDNGVANGPIQQCVDGIISSKWEFDKGKAEQKQLGSGAAIPRPSQAGLCISIYRALPPRPGYSGYDQLYFLGLGTIVLQLGIAAIPCGLYGDWGIMLVTAAGTILALATSCLEQWTREKWACRRNSKKNIVLTKGNGAQHAFVILGNGVGLDLEDLAFPPPAEQKQASFRTRLYLFGLATLWICLLITATGLESSYTWYLMAIGGVGIIENIIVSGKWRYPKAYGIPLEFVEVIGEPKVMKALYKVEDNYPRLGRSMLATFFPGDLRDDERDKWAEYEIAAAAHDAKTD